MADSTPFLSTDSEPPLHEHRPSLSSTIEHCIGDFNLSQFLQVLLVSFAWAFNAQQTFISIFTDAEPPWHCTQHDGESCNSATSNMCNIPNRSWAWDRPRHSFIISEWALECSSFLITGLPASSFFMGCLVGGLVLATLADSSFGRKNMLFCSCLLVSFSSFLAVFSPNIWIYSALKFLCGFVKANIITSALVLTTELVGERRRGQVGVIGFFCFALGFLSLPAIAYTNRDSSWRNLYVWTSLPTMLYSFLVRLFVRESPRWLLLQGKKEEAVKTLRSISSLNRSSLNLAMSSLSYKEENWNVNLYSALKILLLKKWSSRRLFRIMGMGIGIGLVYYGMPLGLGILSFNLYLSVTFNALSELPASILTFLLIDKFNRRSALLLFTFLSGVCSILSIMEGKPWMKLQIWFELVSFFSACTAIDIYLIYTTELFPTCVRNSAISMARQAVVFGGAFGPLLVAAGGRGHRSLCYGVFGLVIGFSGVFVISLPETRGRALSDTLNEEENKERVVLDGIGHVVA